MNEFDKIKQLSDGLLNKKEPTFTPLNPQKNESEEISEKPVIQPTLMDDLLDDTAPNFAFSAPLVEQSVSVVRPILFVGGLLFVLVGVACAGAYFFSTQNDSPSEVVTITSSDIVVKEKPIEVGGVDIPDQDKMVYQRIRNAKIHTKVESLFPEPEKPVVPKILTENEVIPEKIAPKTPVPVVKKEEIKLKTTPVVQKMAKDMFSAQVFSSNNKQKVEELKNTLLKKHGDILKANDTYVVEAKIAGKGVFYRLRFGQFKTRNQAVALCDALKKRKQDCIAVK